MARKHATSCALMHVSIDDFWELAVASELLSGGECEQLHADFSALKGAEQQANARSLAQWLVATGRLTRYQASVLLSGRPGPFVFGPFVITDRIDSGPLARVYRAAYDRGRSVFLVFLSQLTDDPQNYRTLAEMAQAAAAVKNPHVSRTYQVVRHRSQSFIVVEPLAGESLAQLLSRQKFAQPAACQLAFQVSLGLVAMHDENLVHGAVCPHHIWIDASGTARLLQFPLVPTESRLHRHEPPLVDYLAPELAERRPQPPTPLSDIYALGCTLFELLAGRVVFPGGNPQQKVARQRAEFPQRLDQLDSQIPEELADLVAEMLAKDPLLRCQTASHVVHLLAPFAAGSQQRTRQPPKLDPGTLTPGYGAWKAPDWKSPPKSTRPAAAPRLEPSAEEPAPSQPSIEPAIVVGGSSAGIQKERPRAAPDMAVVVTDTSASATISLSPRRASKSTLIGLVAGFAAMAALAIGAVIANRADRAPNAPPADSAKQPTVTAPPTDALLDEAKSPASDVVEVADDGQTLWVSPTAGEPLEPAFVPNGSQLLLVVRPAEMWGSAEGERLKEALGPAGTWIESHLQTTLGVAPADIEQLTVAFAPDASLAPQAAFVARLARDIPAATLLAAWGNPAAAKHQGHEYFQGAAYAYHFPASGEGRVVAVAPPALMKEMLELGGRPLLRSGVERLLRASDDARHFNLLFTPSYLLTDGKELLAGHLAQLRGPLHAFLDERIEAVLCSAHLDEELFVEFRAVAPIDRPPLELLDVLQQRWQAIPEQLETHVASLDPHPYGRLLIHRFPRMVQLARDFTRGGVDDGQVVLNAYLPASAAHNLVLASELTLLESSGAVRPAAAVDHPTSSASPAVAEMLKRKITLSFPRESLGRAMELLAEELGVEIVIVGADLEADGITRNQSLNKVDQRDQPAEAILRYLLKLANPDGKLVYVIKPNDAGQEAIYITTRAAAAKHGDPLPTGF